MEELEVIICKMKNAAAEDHRGYAEADTAFHLRLAEISRNSILSEMLLSIRSLLRVWIYTDVERNWNFAASFQEHAAIFDAIKRGGLKGGVDCHGGSYGRCSQAPESGP